MKRLTDIIPNVQFIHSICHYLNSYYGFKSMLLLVKQTISRKIEFIEKSSKFILNQKDFQGLYNVQFPLNRNQIELILSKSGVNT